MKANISQADLATVTADMRRNILSTLQWLRLTENNTPSLPAQSSECLSIARHNLLNLHAQVLELENVACK